MNIDEFAAEDETEKNKIEEAEIYRIFSKSSLYEVYHSIIVIKIILILRSY